MAEFMFGVGHRKPSRKDAATIDRIAREHGCTFVELTRFGDRYEHWFASPNMGDPFDSERARSVFADLDKAGVRP